MTDLLFLVGRVLFGGLFLYNGLNHFLHYEATRGYTAYKHVPLPAVATIISGVWLLAGTMWGPSTRNSTGGSLERET